MDEPFHINVIWFQDGRAFDTEDHIGGKILYDSNPTKLPHGSYISHVLKGARISRSKFQSVHLNNSQARSHTVPESNKTNRQEKQQNTNALLSEYKYRICATNERQIFHNQYDIGCLLMNILWDTYCSNGQQYAYDDNVQMNLNLGMATLTNNRASCAHI